VTAQIRTLLFDIGNVLINIEPRRGYHWLNGLFTDTEKQILSPDAIATVIGTQRKEIWHKAGTGDISAEGIGSLFLQAIAAQNVSYQGDVKTLRKALSDEFEPLPERIALLNRLIDDGRYQVALVSDTNEWHMSHIEETIPQIFSNLSPERRFYSHAVKYRKENGPDIYRHVMQALDASPETSLMIDDRDQNKKGADVLGLNFLHVQKDENLEKRLRDEWGIRI
jgi:FMN phosphatase YigB (HAD superfamily)